MQKVSLVKCTSYEEKEVYEAVKKSIELIGGLNIRNNSKVLIKPNLLRPDAPDSHVTTHPLAIKAIIRLLKEKNCEIFVGDSPGFHDPLQTAKVSGILDICEQENVKFLVFKNKKSCLYKDAILMKRFDLTDIIDQVDYIINVPKLKTHVMMGVTFAIKNTFGLVVGLDKSQMHLKLQSPEKFASMLVDINNFVKPHLNVMDGVIGMEGNGPGNGDIKKVGIISASYDSLAMDIVMCNLVGFDPLIIQTNKIALSRKEPDFIKNIEIVGEELNDVKIKFKRGNKKPLSTALPKGFFNILNQLINSRPVINNKKCKVCGECIKICPAKTISMKDYGDKKAAFVNKRNCIRCFCCHEICPYNAIILKKGSFSAIFEKLRKR